MKPKTYANDEVEITFDLKKCMHSEHCWRELGSVFDPKKRPWIDPDGADAARIRDQVGRCPSGALSITLKNENMSNQKSNENAIGMKPLPNGPVMIEGNLKWQNKNGEEEVIEGPCALCRCGSSDNKPFCDGSHSKIGFKAD
jgi:uncharacterized Fe-S cluster protein YjdI